MIHVNFPRREFACHCGCGFAAVDTELNDVLVDLREHFGVPVSLTSACRCLRHNKAVGGAEHSFHLLGMAADIVVKGVPAKIAQDYLDMRYPGKYGVGYGEDFTHVDVRPIYARWSY